MTKIGQETFKFSLEITKTLSLNTKNTTFQAYYLHLNKR
ncbi:hypothetical protein BC781_10760 [Sediminitomix flava]|uniref:Uncharacterized protein n=1 Tax=Sediminitomix flava TaxID=379075 RepID=A0A315Z667_SEDFL|nr:hypothetical protein BC781_10760 [Sediminitomix flava]